jgi:hypothetical protein
MSEIDLASTTRKIVRWRILRALEAGQPYPVTEDILLLALQDQQLSPTAREIRVALNYLEERELIHLEGRDTATWSAKLSRTGIDLVEYTIPCEPGIARPQR